MINDQHLRLTAASASRPIRGPLDPGVGAGTAAQRSLEHLPAGFPNAQAPAVAAFIKSQQEGINSLRAVLYVLARAVDPVGLFDAPQHARALDRRASAGDWTLRAIGMTPPSGLQHDQAQ